MTIKLGKLLTEQGLITQEQLQKALQAQRTYGGKLGTNLIELGLISDAVLVQVLSKQLQMQSAYAHEFEAIAMHTLKIFPKEFVALHKIIPLQSPPKLRVALSDPVCLPLLNSYATKHKLAVLPVIAPEIWITAALERYYGIPRETRYISAEATSLDTEKLEITSLTDYEVNFDDDIAPQTQSQEPPSQSLREILSMDEYVRRLETTNSITDTFSTLFYFLSPYCSKIALFSVRDETVQGMMVQGVPLHNRAFSELKCPIASSYLMGQIASQQKAYVGLLDESLPEMNLIRPLDIPKDRKVGIYPITVRGKTMAVLLLVPDPVDFLRKGSVGKAVSDAIIKSSVMLDIHQLRKQLRAPV